MAEDKDKLKVNIDDIEEEKELDENEMKKTKGGVEFLISATSGNNFILEGELDSISKADPNSMGRI